MDPNIMRLLEEDEDETMHSGADVEAFQAALNRDIGGDVSNLQPSDSSAGKIGNANNTEELDAKNVQRQHHQEQHTSATETKQNGPNAENQQQQGGFPQEPTHPPLLKKTSQDDIKQELVEQAPLQTPQSIGMQSNEKNPTPKSEPDPHLLNFQKMSNQQTAGTDQAGNQKNSKQIPFAILLPALKPHLDKDREMQLQTLYNKLRKNEIAKDQFVRLMRNIVGDQVLRLAAAQLQSQPGTNQSQLQPQAGRQLDGRMPAGISAAQFPDPHHSVLHPRGSIPAEPSHNPPSAVQLQTDSSIVNSQKSKAVEWKPDSLVMQASQSHSSNASISNQERERSSISMQGQNKQQQHVNFPPTSFPMYGSSGGNYHPYSGTNVSTSGPSVKPQPHDPQTRQISHHQNLGGTQIGGPTHSMISTPKFERQNSADDPSRVHSGSVSHYTNKSALQQNSAPWQAPPNREKSPASFSSLNYVKPGSLEQAGEQQNKPQLSSPQVLSPSPVEKGNAISGNLKDQSLDKQSTKIVFSTVPPNSAPPSIVTQMDPNGQAGSRISSVASPAGVNARTPPKKPSVGQKKPFEALGSSPPASTKKHKVSGAFSDQSIEQLNDVTAVSGVNLREEEEQLFSGPKEDSRVSEASRRFVQEEEERLMLQKTPLKKKLGEIMAKCGLKNFGTDVERCLSLCVEERMRGLISNMIRLSKQRVDAEKPRHQTLITSDVQQQIMTMNRKAQEELEKKQAEAEKLQKVNEPDGDNGGEGEKEKDEGRVKSVKANKEEDDKMRTTAANVAARAAVGGDDILSKWQLMAEQARQKREGGMEGASGSQPVKDVNRKPLSPSGRNMMENLDAEKRSHVVPSSASGAGRKSGRNQAIVPQTKVVRTISVKDVMSVLEREPQMSRSTLIYQLYERIRSDATAE